MFCKLLQFTALLCCIFHFTNAYVAKVKTVLGEIIGKQVKLDIDGDSYEVNQYLGIHYAKPPVAELRFRMPEPYGELNSPYNASIYGYICPQMYQTKDQVVGTEDEDCLNLNVFVPVSQEPDEANGYAVMIRIHGGSFISGSSQEFEPSTLCSVGNVIIVTFNYRLGPFGFLSTMDSNFVNNLGLWDQQLALKWVRDNIKSFGGDTSRITIFGESSGAVSAIIHGMYPESSGLFHRIIAQSGAPSMGNMNFSRDCRSQVVAILQKLGCAVKDLACLQTKPFKEIITKIDDMAADDESYKHVLLYPIVDGHFIKQDPKDISKLVKTQSIQEIDTFRSFDFLGGMNAYEGACYIPYLSEIEHPEQYEPTSEDLKTLILTATEMAYNRTFPDPVMKMIEFEYTNWSNPSDFLNIRLQITKIFGDLGVTVPTTEFGRLHSNSTNAESYMYKFMPAPTTRLSRSPKWTPGADHGDEMSFVFGVEESNVTEWEWQLSNLMMRYWTNFAKTGNPNGPITVDPEWPEYELDTQYYMEFDKEMNTDSVKQYLYAREYEFWRELFPKMVSSFDELQRNTPKQIEMVDEHVHDDL